MAPFIPSEYRLTLREADGNVISSIRANCIYNKKKSLFGFVCEFFNHLDFPMDIFALPQRPAFLVGISKNIPANGGNNGN